LLLSPWLDLYCNRSSYEKFRDYDYLSANSLLQAVGFYVEKGQDRSDPRLSPGFAKLHGLPPILLNYGGKEAFVDECMELLRNARNENVKIIEVVDPHSVHDYVLLNAGPGVANAHNEFAKFIVSCFQP